MRASGDFFAARKAVKLAGTIDGKPFHATLLPAGLATWELRRHWTHVSASRSMI